MCGFLLTSQHIEKNHPCIDELSRRGPDHTSLAKIGHITGIHTLLSITGDFTEQPLSKNGVYVFFNGEIYNYRELGDYSSDGYAILDGYMQIGTQVFHHLDGEYAILIYDTRNNQIIAATDTFGTKPFWFGHDTHGFAFASLASAITQLGIQDPKELPPNSVTVYSLSNLKIISRTIVTKFSLKQTSNNLDAWCEAFDLAVKVRARLDRPKEQIFIGLSTGYDSGAIAASLCTLQRNFLAISLVDPLLTYHYMERSEAIKSCADHYLIQDDRKTNPITPLCEPYDFTNFSMQGDYIETGTTIFNDSGALGLWIVCQRAKKLGLRVYISGSGADEIISDYGFAGSRIYGHSNFGGYFTNNLYNIFPWPSFFGSTMRSYLRKEEYITGHCSIEGRYPFLDRNVVQNYLSLDHNIKNGVYKAPIDYYLTQKGFPYERERKHGF